MENELISNKTRRSIDIGDLLLLQLMDKLRAENTKLKEENRALTRVVAKLSR